MYRGLQISPDALRCSVSARESLRLAIGLPESGRAVMKPEEVTMVESVKATSGVYVRLTGKRMAQTTALIDQEPGSGFKRCI